MRFRLFATVLTAFAVSAGGAAAQSGTLTLYTSQPNEDAAETVEAFNAQYPDVEVEVFRSGTTKVMGKLMSEISGGNPQPDVLLIADVVNMEKLKAGGHLMAYQGADLSGFDSKTYDADKTYFGTKLITTGLIYNTAAQHTPETWEDLTEPWAKGKVIMPSPLYSGAAVNTMGILTRADGLGWDYYEALAENDVAAVRGNGTTLKQVASGQKAYGMVVDFLAFNAKAQGSPVDFMVPERGLTWVSEPVAILESAENKEAARAFVDFLLSKQGQGLASSQGYIPAKSGVEMPDWLPEDRELTLMEKDAGAILETMEQDLKRFEELFGAS
ncbi:ABC transporter substrate-binding protein [Rhodovibrio salinarum]|uniref:ABC transporter substrate-binding protein n=1 Tax=Rhodovibrio salinarum TaxID=1087 RepID=A0A934V0B6_9PROT|nr:ABC transporter substrate-binding protein [Rhodovibrio salinarum]MBK1697255.1 ABC transporter substrate-binding protein [Rhodovibrio salinarum]